ncbi:MAG: DUF3987 domain-containing protein, partial [Verrucomicrobia bacterium]|nr:DUF3987 domain-containing protein [Verrucomicrobiota bacterium]
MDITAEYNYSDETGALLFQTVRMEPKSFRQRHRNGGTDWTWNLEGVRRVPYRLPELLEGVKAGRVIFIVEGEKDADRLTAEGMVATCNPMGAGKWDDSYSALMRGAKRVIVVPDNDQPGRDHADAVAASLRAVGVDDVRILTLPNLPEKGDVSTWLDAGHSIDDLKSLAKNAHVAKVADVARGPVFAEFTPLGLAAGDPAPFPVDHLPDVVRDVVLAYQRYAKAPMSLVVSSALACVSFACQGKANVARDNVLIGPISLNLMPIAESGERKSGIDKKLGQPIDAFIDAQRELMLLAEADHQRELDLWATNAEALKNKLKRAVTKQSTGPGVDTA